MLRSSRVTWTSSCLASRCAQATPAKPPPTTTTWRCPLLVSGGMRGLPLADLRADPARDVLAHAQRVRHRCERRVDRADAREEARVDDVEVVDLVRPAVRVEHGRRRIGPEAAGPRLVGDPRDRDLVLEVGVAREEVVR